MLCNTPIHAGARHYLGIEVSTTRTRLLVMGEDGAILWSSAIPLTSIDLHGLQCQAVSQWTQNITSLVHKAQSDGIALRQILGVGVCATTPTLVATDRFGNAIDDHAIMWSDGARLGRSNQFNTNIALRKMLWLRSKRKKLFAESVYLMDATNFLGAFLTHQVTSSESVLRQKFAWKGGFSLDLHGLENVSATTVADCIDKIPENVVKTGELVGNITPAAAKATGLPVNTPVALGGYDTVCGLVGGGIYEPSDAFLISLGTSLGFYACPQNQEGCYQHWTTARGLLPSDYYVVSGGCEAGMQSIAKIRKELGFTDDAKSNHQFEKLAAIGERQCDASCYSLPFSGVPLRSPLAGRKLGTHIKANSVFPSSEEFLTVMRRGVACYSRYAVDSLQQAEVAVSKIHLVGGGTASRSFCQLVADCCQLPVVRFDNRAATLGAAAMATHAIHGFATTKRVLAAQQVNRETFWPGSRADFYATLYENFSSQLHLELEAQASPGLPPLSSPNRLQPAS